MNNRMRALLAAVFALFATALYQTDGLNILAALIGVVIFGVWSFVFLKRGDRQEP